MLKTCVRCPSFARAFMCSPLMTLYGNSCHVLNGLFNGLQNPFPDLFAQAGWKETYLSHLRFAIANQRRRQELHLLSGYSPEVAKSMGRVLILGGPKTGKSALCRYFVERQTCLEHDGNDGPAHYTRALSFDDNRTFKVSKARPTQRLHQ